MGKHKNSVTQLIRVVRIYNSSRPQLTPVDKKFSGSGFIIEIVNGLVLTNAHVVSNTISISSRITKSGEHDFFLRIISICHKKDKALCQLSQDDIKNILHDTTPIQLIYTLVVIYYSK